MEKQKSITELLLDKYQKQTTETSRKITLSESSQLDRYECYLFKDLDKTVVKGFPIGSDFIDTKTNMTYSMEEHKDLPHDIKERCELQYHYLPLTHEVYIGTTGSGKTTGCVEPHVRALGLQKNKPNMFITDPKGELFKRNAYFLKEQGYKIFVLNFKDLEHSDKWNPLLAIYDSYMRIKDLMVEPVRIEGIPNDSINTERLSDTQNGVYWLFDNKAFDTKRDVDKYIIQKTDLIKSETDSLVKELAFIMCPITNDKDVTWEQGSQQAFEGIIQCMLEDALNCEETGFTKDMFTIKTIFDYINALNQLIVVKDDESHFGDLHFIKGRKKAIEKMSIVYANSPKTRRNYMGVFEGQLGEWRQGHIFSLTTGNTINIENLNQPFAIFIITRDYEKSDFKIAGLFIDEIYKKLVKRYDENSSNGMSNERATHFILDEFGNIPKIENFDNKIATCRSRNIWMHLFLQSYEQLSFVYKPEQAEIIISNCNSQIFLGSQSYKTITRFSNECGKCSTRRLSNIFQNSYEYIESNVVKASDLNLIEPGSMYNKRIFSPVIYSRYIRSYYLKENNLYTYLYKDTTFNKVNLEGFSEKKFCYDPVVNFNDYIEKEHQSSFFDL